MERTNKTVVLEECHCDLDAQVEAKHINDGLACFPMWHKSLHFAASHFNKNRNNTPIHFVELGYRWHLLPFDKVTRNDLRIHEDLLP